MDKPPTKAKRKPKRAKPPEELDADLRRVLLRAAETCQERFDENPTRYAYHLSIILDALGRHPHLIDPIYRFMESAECPTRFPGVAPVVAIGGVPIRRIVRDKDGYPIWNKDGDAIWQRVQGRKWEGTVMVATTRWAIEEYDGHPENVVAKVVRELPPLLRADCRDANKDPDEIALAIADLLIDDGTGKRKQGWRDPEAVLRAILRKLGHPAPDNLTP